jgi:hypothetical protein
MSARDNSEERRCLFRDGGTFGLQDDRLNVVALMVGSGDDLKRVRRAGASLAAIMMPAIGNPRKAGSGMKCARLFSAVTKMRGKCR